MNLKFLKRKKNYGKKRLDFHQEFYWKLIVTLAFIFTAIFCAFGYYMVARIATEDKVDANASSRPLVEKEKLAKALNYFSEREKKSTEIIGTPAAVVDPSL